MGKKNHYEENVLVVTDIHENEEQVHELIELYKPSYVLDCGDHQDHGYDFYTSKEIPWYFIHGNHENNEMLQGLKTGSIQPENLYYIPNGELVPVGSINFTGMGGNFSGKSYSGKKKPKPLHITPSDVSKLKNMPRKKSIDMLLLHESGKELWEDTNFSYGQEVCSEVINAFPNLQLVVSGHYHEPQDKYINGTRQISLNTPEEYNHILFTTNKGKIEILELENKPSSKTYSPTNEE